MSSVPSILLKLLHDREIRYHLLLGPYPCKQECKMLVEENAK